MRFIDFLSEGDTVHRKELTEGKFLELLREKCKNSHVIATKIPFFRTDKGPDMMLVTPSAKEERSAFWIDKMIKEIPAWNKFPDRSRCIKAYNRYENVNDSNVYVVIPFDGSSVGIAKTESFYRSFDDVEKSIGFDRVDNDSFRKWIEHIFTGLGEILGEKFKTPPLESYSQFKKALSLIDKILERDRNDLKKKFSTFEKFDKNFDVSNDIMETLKAAGEKEKIEFNEEQYKKAEPIIKLQIKALVARDLWDMNEYYRVIDAENESLQKAVEILQTPGAYEKILK